MLDHGRRYRYALLLAALVALMLHSPFVGADETGNLVLEILFTIVLLAAVYAASGRRVTLLFAVVLALPWIYLSWVHPVWRGDDTDVLSGLLLVALAIVVLGVVLTSVLATEHIGFDTLCGAVANYLLIGTIWALCYTLIEALAPGSFHVPEGAAGLDWNDLLYFSLTTLTTLGYGDITPVSPVARTWSTLEAVMGTLYIAVLVARLVGLYRSDTE